MIKNAFLSLACLAAISLSACETVQRDVNNSFGQTGSALQQAFSNLKTANPQNPPAPASVASTPENNAPVLALSGTPSNTTTGPNCPNVRIVSDLNQVHQFREGQSPAPQNEISSVRMQAVDTQCKIAKNSMAIDMNIAFAGDVDPKGRTKAGDKPSFAYPYFVAITNNQGSIIGKEVFALTMSYSGNSNSATRIEQVRQMIPMRDKDYRNYKIMIGFQINDQELAYNRALPPEYMTPSNALSEVEPASGKIDTIAPTAGNE